MRILLIEDDPSLADVLRRGLGEGGHVVDIENNGRDGELSAHSDIYDAIVLDISLPKKDGLAVARDLRIADIYTPILMLTARDTVSDTIAGLNAGADDYLRKPFVFDELEARLRSITRRRAAPMHETLRVDDLELDLATRTVTRAGHTIDLSTRETAFLEFLMLNSGLIITREMIQDALWDRDHETTSNVVDVYVRRLRVKLSDTGRPLIQTIRGAGYRFGPA
jgi:two-component system, OmpR family, response regulator